MPQSPLLKLNDGRSIPQLGLGVWQASNDEAARAVQAALQAGYRHVDTAAIYNNESGVGQGIKAGGIKRDELFITTKVWNDSQGHDSALRAMDQSLRRLGLDYVDLYLIHWPAPRKGLYAETWKALVKLKEQGLAKSIGVSNFTAEHLDKVIKDTGVTPVLNQIELHPRFQQQALRAAHAAKGMLTESWSPLGQGQLLKDATIAAIARKHGRTPAQIIIRWHIENGLVVIPKSVNPARIKENFDVFGFALDAEDVAKIGWLDSGSGRIGPDPMTAAF